MSDSCRENVAWAWHRETTHRPVGMETSEKAEKNKNIVKYLNNRTPDNFAVLILKYKQKHLSMDRFVKIMQMEWQMV